VLLSLNPFKRSIAFVSIRVSQVAMPVPIVFVASLPQGFGSRELRLVPHGGSACVCIRQEVERAFCGQIVFVDGQVMTGNDDMHAGKQRALDVCGCSASVGVIQRLGHSIAVGGLKSFDDAKSLNPVEEAVLRDRLYELLVRHGGPSAARKRSWFVPHLWYARHPNWRHSNYYCLGPRPPAISHPYGNARTYATRDEYLSAVAK
jgi:hypothetical protein